MVSGATGPNAVANGPAPEDVQLQGQLESRLAGAQEAAKHHRVELERAQRVIDACSAGLDQLNRPMEKMSADRDPEGPAY